MSSVWIYKVESNKNKKKAIEWDGVSELLTGSVRIIV